MPEIVYGGPYMHESAAIEAELLAAQNEDRDPDLWGLFNDKIISAGAVNLIKTHTEEQPHYEGERYWETIEAHGMPIVEKPFPDYVFPADGGENTVDKEVESTDE
jgi:hypothetical protein